MKKVTTHQAKTHLSRFLAEAEGGEDIIICRGEHPVARLTPVRKAPRRPAIGTRTSEAVGWSPKTFAPLSEEELREWGIV